MDLATIATIDKTALWHANLGWALEMADHYAEAEMSFLKAIELDDTAWWPKYGMACCCAGSQRYGKAADWALKAIALSLKGLEKFMLNLHYTAVYWISESNETERALQLARESYESSPKDVIAIDYYVYVLYQNGHSEQAFSLLKRLNETMSMDGKRTLLTDLLLYRGIYRRVLPLAIAHPICGQDLRTACDALPMDDEGKVDLTDVSRVAHLKYLYFDRIEEAILAWENILKKTDDNLLCMEASDKLASIYFDMAVSAKRDSRSPAPWISKLKDLSIVKSKSKSDNYVYRSNYSALLYGHWLREHEQAKDRVWRACFQAKVLEALNMLDDDDPTNYQEGYHALARVLFLAGDKENAAAAYSIALKPLEILAAQRAQSMDADDPKTYDRKAGVKHYAIRYGCDGDCQDKMRDYKELYACEICKGVLFCEACIKLIKADELPFRVCNSLHAFSQVYPLPTKQQDAVAHVVDGRVEINREWVEKLKKQWKR